MTPNEELAAIDTILDALLTATLKAPPRRTTLTLDDHPAYVVADTPAHGRVLDLISDPVGMALRLAIADVGERLHEIGGMKAMHDAMERAAEKHPDSEERRISIMDQRWSGIGDWMA